MQPIGPMGMTGGSIRRERLIRRVLVAADRRMSPDCEAFPSGLKVISGGKIRYPDATISCGPRDDDSDSARPIIIFEVLSPSTALTDRRVKAVEYSGLESLMVYVMLSQDQPELWVRRRSADWAEEYLAGMEAILYLPEIGIEIPLAELYRASARPALRPAETG